MRLKRRRNIALRFRNGEALWEERVHDDVVRPQAQILETVAEADLCRQQIIVAEVVHHLEVLQLVRDTIDYAPLK